ncbi:hypothetical protein [Sphingobacterium hotanense]|uniref:hypothetical protein n=1 Tax=Sphingobacterium TaxID=28453 RepID=UPI0021A4FD95|nr:hypothetical protein [Sphingobacterium hotanense]MCT1523666.1 hypothetical protein [Sphingobacterium hotanense]
MKNLFKNFDKMGLLAFAAAGVFAISWNAPETKLAPKWYPVTPDTSDPSDESLQTISSTPFQGTPTGDCKNTSGVICAVQLDLGTAPVPATIAEAEDEGINTDTRMHKESN